MIRARVIRLARLGGEGVYNDMPAAPSPTIMGLSVLLPSGSIAFAAGEPRWGVLRSSGRFSTLCKMPRLADIAVFYRHVNLDLSADGPGRCGSSFGRSGKRPAAFLRSRPVLKMSPAEKAGMDCVATSMRTTDGRWLHWEDNSAKDIEGRPLTLAAY